MCISSKEGRCRQEMRAVGVQGAHRPTPPLSNFRDPPTPPPNPTPHSLRAPALMKIRLRGPWRPRATGDHSYTHHHSRPLANQVIVSVSVFVFCILYKPQITEKHTVNTIDRRAASSWLRSCHQSILQVFALCTPRLWTTPGRLKRCHFAFLEAGCLTSLVPSSSLLRLKRCPCDPAVTVSPAATFCPIETLRQQQWGGAGGEHHAIICADHSQLVIDDHSQLVIEHTIHRQRVFAEVSCVSRWRLAWRSECRTSWVGPMWLFSRFVWEITSQELTWNHSCCCFSSLSPTMIHRLGVCWSRCQVFRRLP